MLEGMSALEVWFVTGSQHLYGEAALRQVADNSRCLVESLNAAVAAGIACYEVARRSRP